MTPDSIRADIPGIEDVTYLNYGASGPSPRRVVEAATASLQDHEYRSPGAEGLYDRAISTYDKTRNSVAGLIGADPTEIALTESSTDSINRFASGFDWESDDTVVITDMEHPSGILPWQQLNRRHDVDIRIVESTDGRIDRAAYRKAVQGATLVCFSSLTWNYGTQLPVSTLAEIAHEAGALVLVDAVQSLGQVPVDVNTWNIDALAASGHKWLLGCWGAGILYVNAELISRLEPSTVGYRGVVDPDATDYEFKPTAERFELSTPNPAPFVALQEAIDIAESVGIPTIRNQIHQRTRRLLSAIPDDRRLSPAAPESGLVTIDVDDPDQLVAQLAELDIVVRSVPYPNAVRASVHAVTSAADIDTFRTAITEAL